MKRIVSKADVALMTALVLMAIGGMVWLSGRGGGSAAVVRVDGIEVRTLSLGHDQSLDMGAVRIEVRGGAVAFVASDCPGQECIHMGWLKAPGAAAACLPNRVSVTVLGERGVDAVAD